MKTIAQPLITSHQSETRLDCRPGKKEPPKEMRPQKYFHIFQIIRLKLPRLAGLTGFSGIETASRASGADLKKSASTPPICLPQYGWGIALKRFKGGS